MMVEKCLIGKSNKTQTHKHTHTNTHTHRSTETKNPEKHAQEYSYRNMWANTHINITNLYILIFKSMLNLVPCHLIFKQHFAVHTTLCMCVCPITW